MIRLVRTLFIFYSLFLLSGQFFHVCGLTKKRKKRKWGPETAVNGNAEGVHMIGTAAAAV